MFLALALNTVRGLWTAEPDVVVPVGPAGSEGSSLLAAVKYGRCSVLIARENVL
jgi:hypothetical protein